MGLSEHSTSFPLEKRLSPEKLTAFLDVFDICFCRVLNYMCRICEVSPSSLRISFIQSCWFLDAVLSEGSTVTGAQCWLLALLHTFILDVEPFANTALHKVVNINPSLLVYVWTFQGCLFPSITCHQQNSFLRFQMGFFLSLSKVSNSESLNINLSIVSTWTLLSSLTFFGIGVVHSGPLMPS